MPEACDIAINLQPKQFQLWNLCQTIGPTAPTWLGYGGARGGAKSGAARRVMLMRRTEHPGTTGFIVRRNFGDLYENHIVKFMQDWPELTRFYSAQHKEYVLPSKHGGPPSRIAFKYADTLTEIQQISRGPEAMDIFVDQAEQFSDQEIMWLHTPNRWPGSLAGQCKTVLFFNPGGVGTEMLRRIFWKREYRGEEKAYSYKFIQAYGWDNYEWFRGQVPMTEEEFYELPDDARFQLFITETSEGRKMNRLPANLRVGELLGSFENFSGQYFAGAWDEEKCVIDRQLAQQLIQPWWTRWMAQDWGFGDHDCNLWFASGKLSPDQWKHFFGGDTDWPMDVVVIYRENIISDRAEADLAMDIVNATPAPERKQIQRFFLSQDAFGQRARQFGAHSVGEQFSRIMNRYGMPSPEPADQDRVNGWRFMYNGFRQANLRGTIFDEERSKEGPAVFVSTDCPQVISHIPLAVRDEKDPEDVMRVEGALWEDITDAVRYGLKSMLNPKSQAPRQVRAQELMASIPGETAEAVTARAMAMLRFNAGETRKTRVAPPRWR